MPIPHGGGDIGVWCNGSTIDFGSISSSSNLDTLTTTNQNIYYDSKKQNLQRRLS